MRGTGAFGVTPDRTNAAGMTVSATDGASAPEHDEALALAARQKRDAFLTLYTRYVGRIERYVLARVPSSSDVEDVVSIVFMRALERIYQFQPSRGSFAAWLFTIARNTVTDHYRTGRRFIPAMPQHDREVGPSAEETSLHHERLGSLELAVKNLTRDQRDALALRYGAGLHFAEIGRVLGRSDDAAQKLVRRAIDALRREIEKENQA
jgi:RNA polymerase sigma-70 factor, ECF subfamily